MTNKVLSYEEGTKIIILSPVVEGKKGTFRDACETCKKYKARTGSAPARANLKKKKMEKIKERDIRQMLRDY